MTPLDDWRTVATLAKEINEKGPLLSTHALRHYIRDAASNGLQPHIRRLGKKIVLSRSGFAQWLDSRPTMPPKAARGG
jgi:hypothetical protein